MESKRKHQGRPRNPNSQPSDAHLATRKEVLDELDRLVNYQRMSLGKKLESLIAEVKMYRKNLVAQLPQVDLPSTHELSNTQYRKIWQEYDSIVSKHVIEEAPLVND